ncbi:MAG: diaminopimelate epimerase [Candidatus Omnitrophica bacterium]|nr:diaminopimelate epimerase [Candidatus Omnitrophota bacterium]
MTRTRQIPFVKVVGSGNDFILVDARGKNLRASIPSLAKTWCDRKRGVGADGLLWVAPSKKADARMRVFNPDGSEAAMCGNGLRCVAWYLNRYAGLKNHGNGKRPLRLETGVGILQAQVIKPENVRVHLSMPRNLRLGIHLTLRGVRYELHAVNTGVPHAVLPTRSLERIDLARLGPSIRSHRLFQPAGTNVDLLRIDGPHRAAIRTYERGVEAETLACGTGAVASVVIGAALGRLRPPVQVATASGESLTVGFEPTRKPWEGLYLEGPARILFQGILSL